jgi:hypothetical protein
MYATVHEQVFERPLRKTEKLRVSRLTRQKSIRLSNIPISAGAARTFVADTLETWGTGAYVLEAAVLLTSEIVSTAIQDARSPITLVISSTGANVRISVTDHDSEAPTCRIGSDELRGLGLQVVEAFATRWGTTQQDDGKTVWFELA